MAHTYRLLCVCAMVVVNVSRASKSEGGIGAKPKNFIELNGQHPYQTNFQLNLNYVNYAKCVRAWKGQLELIIDDGMVRLGKMPT